MIQKMMLQTIALGLFGLTAGMTVSTFKHYYEKYADFEDLKMTGVQEVTFVGDLEVME